MNKIYIVNRILDNSSESIFITVDESSAYFRLSNLRKGIDKFYRIPDINSTSNVDDISAFLCKHFMKCLHDIKIIDPTFPFVYNDLEDIVTSYIRCNRGMSLSYLVKRTIPVEYSISTVALI